MARFWPRQVRAPRPNGMNRYGFLHAPEIPLTNLSGLNLSALGPQIDLSWCIVEMGIHMLTFLGTCSAPILMSLKVSLATRDAGGNSLRVSCITIVNYAHHTRKNKSKRNVEISISRFAHWISGILQIYTSHYIHCIEEMQLFDLYTSSEYSMYDHLSIQFHFSILFFLIYEQKYITLLQDKS